MESCRQDRTVDIIAFVYMIFVAACIYISGHENIIGSYSFSFTVYRNGLQMDFLYFDTLYRRNIKYDL